MSIRSTDDSSTMSNSHGSGAYDFPLLKNHEVLQYMNETNFRSTESELLEPHIYKEKTLKAFRHVLNHCLGLTVEDVDKKATSRNSRSMELSKDGTSNVPLFLTLQACLRTCGVHDFSWKDIYAPTPKRFRIHMSACIHLAKFRTERRVLYQKRLQSRDDLFKELHGIQKERESLQEQLDQMQTESGEKMEEAGQDVRVCEELALELAKRQKQLASEDEAVEILRRNVTRLKETLEQAQVELKPLEAEREPPMNRLDVSRRTKAQREWPLQPLHHEAFAKETQFCREVVAAVQKKKAEVEALEVERREVQDILSLATGFTEVVRTIMKN